LAPFFGTTSRQDITLSSSFIRLWAVFGIKRILFIRIHVA
jgi:hypothetical protein